MSLSQVWMIGFMATVGALAAVHVERVVGTAGTAWRWYVGQVKHRHDRLFLKETAEVFAKRRGGIAVVAFVLGLLTSGPFTGLLLGSGVLASALLQLHLAFRLRVARFDEQVMDGVRSIANSLRAGLVVPQALDVVVENMAPPISQEFGEVLKEFHLGLALDEALTRLAHRLRSERFMVVLSAFQIARRTGGEVTQVLEETAVALDEIARLEGKLQAMTAQGRLQLLLMSSIPPVFILIMYLIQPPAIEILFIDPLGQLILAAILALQLIGMFLMHKIMSTEV